MASTAENLVPGRRSDAERIIDFSPELLRAPFLLRCAALFIDYMIFVGLPVAWLLASRFFTDSGAPSVGIFAWVIGGLMIAVNFLLFPLLRGQTMGKMVAGITIVNIDGSDVRLSGVLRRNVVGYAVTILTGGLGFLLAGLNSSGRAVHDLIGGTIVVRGRRIQK